MGLGCDYQDGIVFSITHNVSGIAEGGTLKNETLNN